MDSEIEGMNEWQAKRVRGTKTRQRRASNKDDWGQRTEEAVGGTTTRGHKGGKVDDDVQEKSGVEGGR